MNITIISSSNQHPVYLKLENWVKKKSNKYNISLVTKSSEVQDGDFLFLISCTEIIPKKIRDKFRYTLVVHASDLPKGKGWSPYVWQILEGSNQITVSLFEAVDKFDEGDIWEKKILELEGHELYSEIHEKLSDVTISLMEFAIKNPNHKPNPQPLTDSTYYPKRTPKDSQLDPNKTIKEQFELMRVADENRYPCFFYFRGYKYNIMLKKYKDKTE
jgi:methionyl-tRNA formyltransferase